VRGGLPAGLRICTGEKLTPSIREEGRGGRNQEGGQTQGGRVAGRFSLNLCPGSREGGEKKKVANKIKRVGKGRRGHGKGK